MKHTKNKSSPELLPTIRFKVKSPLCSQEYYDMMEGVEIRE